MLDVEVIRKDFPILDQIVNDEPWFIGQCCERHKNH